MAKAEPKRQWRWGHIRINDDAHTLYAVHMCIKDFKRLLKYQLVQFAEKKFPKNIPAD